MAQTHIYGTFSMFVKTNLNKFKKTKIISSILYYFFLFLLFYF